MHSQTEARGTPRFARLLAVGVAALAGFVFAAPSMATPVTFAEIVNQTDWTQAGIAGVGDSASVNITLSGVSGTVTKAYVYYHGIGNPRYAPTGVTFAGVPVAPVSLGDATTNCWGSGSSTAYRADVTAQVTGNGTYTIANLANGAGMNANGASLIVFFDDGNAANNRDVALFEGNDSDHAAGFPGETNGWHATLSNITYTTGTANVFLHAADGQAAADGNVVFTATPNNGGTNPLTIVDTATLWEGVSLPDAGRSRLELSGGQGDLYDIHGFDITPLFNSVPDTYTVNLDQNPASDCLGLILAVLDFEAGALPPKKADISITKTASPDPAFVGDNVTYTLAVTNNGPDVSSGGTVTDTLPANVSYVSDDGGCTNVANTVTCPTGPLANGASQVIHIVVTATAAGPATNTACVKGIDEDDNTANDCATVTSQVISKNANLSIAKTGPAFAQSGGSITYQITVTNGGPAVATNVTMSDPLPAGETLVSATPSQGSCGAPVVTCNLGSLAGGGSATVTIVVTVTAASGSTVCNTANTSADQPDPNTSNNSSTTCAFIFAISAGGMFVIGDLNSAVGTSVTFWGAQWWKLNRLSGGAAPAAFKGFEDAPPAPGCGTHWTTDPGNSTPPPAGPLPAYIAVIVSSSISKSGSTISGNTPHIAIVKTDPGYMPNPGHAGTGTVFAQVC